MNVTVAICTWNRADLLDRTLTKLRELRVPSGLSWELLVVNNNCTDHTDAVISAHADRLPLQRLFEPQPGLSNARNAALTEARGELILWTDDDVLAAPDWLEELARAATAFPAATYFGGTVTPWFEVPPPRWLSRGWSRLGGLYAVRELGTEVRPFGEHEVPFGANMMFRTAALRAFRFDPELGHKGQAAIGGEETDVVRRMREAGHTGVWVGPARVEHFIPAARMTKRYVWDYARRLGGHHPPVPVAGESLWLGVPRWLWRQYLTSRARSGWAAACGSSGWAAEFLRAAGLRARIDWYQARRTAMRRCPPTTKSGHAV